MMLSVGQVDTTSDDSTRLAARAARDGVNVVLDVNAEMIHGFHGLAGLFPEAHEASTRVGDFVQRHIPDA
jgi:acetyl esterase/lipase